MKESKAIDLVTHELNIDEYLYRLKPEDVERFFIGEDIIVAAATIFIAGFVKGVQDSSQKKSEELSMFVTNWIIGKIGGLFRKPDEAKAQGDEAKKEMDELAKSASTVEKTPRDSALNAVEETLTKELVKLKMPSEKATDVAKKSRAAAEAILGGPLVDIDGRLIWN